MSDVGGSLGRAGVATSLSGTPFTWLEFAERGALKDPTQAGALNALLIQGVTDLVVMSHGWKNTKEDAQALYGELWSNVRPLLAAQQAHPAGDFVVAGVQWPALEYRTNFDSPATDDGTTQPLPDPVGSDGDLSPQAFQTVVGDAAELAGPAGPAVDSAATAAADDPGQDQAAALLRTLAAAFPARITNADPELAAMRDPLVENDPRELVLDLTAPPPMTVSRGVAAAQGLGSLIGHALSGPRAAIGRLLNQFTYYEMKARAGDIGAALGARTLSTLTPAGAVRLHLIGHSFGARLLTSAVASFAAPSLVELRSLTLLQAAFSQNAFSANFGGGQPGAFARVMQNKVGGPITATHTHNDSACTLAYALASRLVRDNAEAIGDASDPFGAIGANGILHLLPAQVVFATMSVGGTYAFTPGEAHNFLADACITGHNDVRNPQVGRLVAAALLA